MLFLCLSLWASTGWGGVCHPYADLKRVLISDIRFTQLGLRKPESVMQGLEIWMRAHQGLFPFPITLVVFEDGSVYVRNGHHRLEMARRLGKTEFERGRDFILEPFTHDQFQEINLAQGWITPFDPRTTLRLPNIAGFKALIQMMQRRGVPLYEIESFIRAHPDAYSIAMADAKAFAQGGMARRFEGSIRDREDYFRKMDRSMPMKIGQLLPVFPSSGVVYEPGMGSAMQAAAHAALYPDLLVVASDLDEQAVRRAQARNLFDNIVFFRANALTPVFPMGFLDAVSDSSMGHHLVSYGEPPFREERVSEYHYKTNDALRPHGCYGCRDFVVAPWPDVVQVTLPTAARTGNPPFGQLSLTELFLNFQTYFRSHDYPSGALIRELPETSDEFRRFEAPGEFVQNFLLRINYTDADSWPAEMREQYTYFDQAQYVESVRRAGFRVDYASGVYNPWIIERWWEANHIRVTDTQGKVLGWPPTNFVLYATRLETGMPRRLSVKAVEDRGQPDWLTLESFKKEGTPGQIFDVVKVPGVTHFYLPYGEQNGHVYVYLFRDVERPGYVFYQHQGKLSSATYGGYHAEGIAHVVPEHVAVASAFGAVMARKAGEGIPASVLNQLAFEAHSPFFPSSGGSNEVVVPFWVPLKPGQWESQNPQKLRRVELNQLIASAQVGAIPDPRLEAMAYGLGRSLGTHFLSWIGPQVPQEPQRIPQEKVSETFALATQAPSLPLFQPSFTSANFMRIQHVTFEREIVSGPSTEVSLEFAVPKNHSLDTLSVLPYAVSEGGQIYVGLEQRELPAFETRGMNPRVQVIPAWRLPQDVGDLDQAKQVVTQRMQKDFDLHVKTWSALGEGYFPSPAQTPEHVFPFAVQVDMSQPPRDLTFYPLAELLTYVDDLPDLHTRLAIYRFAHAIGKL